MPARQQWPWEAQKVRPQNLQEEAWRAYKRDSLKTIILPLGGLAVFLVGLGVAGALLLPPTSTHNAASAVTILTSVICMLVGLPYLAILVVAIYLSARLKAKIPSATSTALEALDALDRRLRLATNKTVSPITRTESTLAAVKAFVAALTSKHNQ